MYVLHVNEVHEMWQDAARGSLKLIIYLFICLFITILMRTNSNSIHKGGP